jgi:hypothetical protein
VAGVNSSKIEQQCILGFVCLRGRTRLDGGGNLWHYLGELWVPLRDRSSKVALSAVNAGLSVVETFTYYLKMGTSTNESPQSKSASLGGACYVESS